VISQKDIFLFILIVTIFPLVILCMFIFIPIGPDTFSLEIILSSLIGLFFSILANIIFKKILYALVASVISVIIMLVVIQYISSSMTESWFENLPLQIIYTTILCFIIGYIFNKRRKK